MNPAKIEQHEDSATHGDSGLAETPAMHPDIDSWSRHTAGLNGFGAPEATLPITPPAQKSRAFVANIAQPAQQELAEAHHGLVPAV